MSLENYTMITKLNLKYISKFITVFEIAYLPINVAQCG